MTHSPRVKAQAMAMLLTGDTVGYVAKKTGAPKQTVSRGRVDADYWLRGIVQDSSELRAVVASIYELMPGLLQGNGTKKDALAQREDEDATACAGAFCHGL